MLFSRALVLLGLIAFGFFLGFRYGLLQLVLEADRSYLSTVIFVLYLLATGQWLWLALGLTRESQRLAQFEVLPGDTTAAPDKGLVGELFENLRRDAAQSATLIEAFGDTLINRHAFGHFASDVLLRLGLLGTIVGFILMLLPVAEIQDFDSAVMQRLLSAMSGGMAIALYTTLAGLISSTLLKLQYHLLDSAAAALVTRLSVVLAMQRGGAGPSTEPDSRAP